MNGSSRSNWRSPRAQLDLAQRALNEALRAADEAAWRQAPALVEIIGPRSRQECAKILTPLIHHHYEGFKRLSEEDRCLIYRELGLLLKRAAPDLTDEQIGQLLAKPSATFDSSRTSPLDLGPEGKQLEERVTLLTWECHQYLHATFEPSPTLLAIVGQRTRRQYLGILRAVRLFERYRLLHGFSGHYMFKPILQHCERTLFDYAPDLPDAQIEQLFSVSYADLDPEGLVRSPAG